MSEGDLLGALAALGQAGVRCVVIGAGGINFYVPADEPPLATVDLDIVLEPEIGTIKRALALLHQRGFRFEVGGEPFLDIADDLVLRRLIEVGGTVGAHSGEAFLDVMLSMPGVGFVELDADAVEFEVGGVRIRVGKLERLLAAKKRAGRAKDIEFLRAFAARFGPPKRAKKGKGKKRPRKQRPS